MIINLYILHYRCCFCLNENGNVRLGFSTMPDDVGANGSICRRHATAWAHFSPEHVQINSKVKADFYCWGARG
ncbi:hypothetical protein [Marinomonas spartinae]|uniref:hypothetical protein n=1 Tax=Marinomonas spartinae TaxID=1792290 RepID=UPI0020C8C065|nr:hypothetical protein [Marinomonas spartinae]